MYDSSADKAVKRCAEDSFRNYNVRMTREGTIEIMKHLRSIVSSEDYIEAFDMAIEALKEQERIIKLLEELRDDPIMHCSEDYWEGHYMAAKEAIAIVRGEAE